MYPLKSRCYGEAERKSPGPALELHGDGVDPRHAFERFGTRVLDADIRSFFDTLKHEWLVKFIEHRVADRRVVRLIQKWLAAGVLEDGKRTQSEVGTVQGGSISPLLANLYLHHVFDLWVRQWRHRQARGDVVVVRFADDFVVGFQHRHEAERFLAELRERFAQFGLELHPDKTRLLRFGRFAAQDVAARGAGKPQTFNFLGFTHCCGKTHKGRFTILRLTMRQRWQAKLSEVNAQTQATHAPARPGAGRLCARGRSRACALLWRAPERCCHRRFPAGNRPHLVESAASP